MAGLKSMFIRAIDWELIGALILKSKIISLRTLFLAMTIWFLGLARKRTRLNEFSEKEQCQLFNWRYALCDSAIRKYV